MTSPDIASLAEEHAEQDRLRSGRIGARDRGFLLGGSTPPFDIASGPNTRAHAAAHFTAKEVSDMNRLAERLGYLWQRYVAWRDPRPFNR
jgi:hypothetical protein